ncbi:cytochrome b [Shewanella youngdeokensis]|uniref:Cytochrome b n=1 Tax=Shewanella youngdeokensis TaxID=2999068 RepID=A0ABZ0JZW1_9GAMM|nr:cytochrome b [Shewanella sp. DAU334]
MMKKDTASQFSPMTLLLHWVVGVTMVALLAMGVVMVQTENYGLFSWHKSFGVIIFFVVILRVIWRSKNGWPTPVSQYSHLEHITAKIIHWVLIVGTVLMPITGFLNSSVGGHGVVVFGVELVARNVDPNNPRSALAHSEALYSAAHVLHYAIGYIVIFAVLLHVVGALKHHIIDKDGTLKRMLGSKV